MRVTTKRVFYKAKLEIPGNSVLYLIEWEGTEGTWHYGSETVPQGVKKVVCFLLKRKMILESMGIYTEFFKVKQSQINDDDGISKPMAN